MTDRQPILSSEKKAGAFLESGPGACPRRRFISRTFLALSCLAMLSGIAVLVAGWTSDLPASYALGLPLLLGGLLGFFIWDVLYGPFLKRLRRLT